MPRIEETDRNFLIKDSIGDKDIVFRNALSDEVDLYGLLSETPFRRIPEKIAFGASVGVGVHNKSSAGGRVRFMTASLDVAIRAHYPEPGYMAHMPLSGKAGFDMYEYVNGEYSCIGHFIPPTDLKNTFETIATFSEKRMRDITINFPAYTEVSELFIGVSPDATLKKGGKYINDKPVIFYGSSITQGGCSTRPGTNYQNMISRRFNLDYRNLGFSGNAKGEPIMADYIAEQEMCMFVMDYDHNAPSPEELKNTHESMFLKVREKHPDMPIVIVTKTDIPKTEYWKNYYSECREIIRTTYNNAIAHGDKNVAFIDGSKIFDEVKCFGINPDCCTVDGCHPNDLGFAAMAKVIGDEIGRMLNLEG